MALTQNTRFLHRGVKIFPNLTTTSEILLLIFFCMSVYTDAELKTGGTAADCDIKTELPLIFPNVVE